MILQVTEQQIYDYMRCPVSYKLKHDRKIVSTHVSLKNLLEPIAKSFYLYLMDGRVTPMHELRKKWDGTCRKYKLENKQVLEGIDLLVKFHRWAANEKPIVLDVGSLYSLRIGNIEMAGNGGIVLATGSNMAELLVLDFGTKLAESIDIDRRLKWTMQCIAAQQQLGFPVSGIRMYNVKFDKNLTSIRGQSEFDRLEASMLAIGKALEQDIIYPRDFACSGCDVKDICAGWRG